MQRGQTDMQFPWRPTNGPPAPAPSGMVPWRAAAVTDTTLQSSATSLPGKWKAKCQELAKAILAGDTAEALRLAHTYHASAFL